MLYCEECNFIFERPRIAEERHGLCSPPFERLYCCPKCGGLNILSRKGGNKGA